MNHLRTGWTALALALTVAGLAGCATPPAATSAMLTYETKPEGAQLFEGGQPIGVAPVTRTYAGDGKSDQVRTPVVTAVWASGAKESFYTFLPLGADRVAVIERPAAAPGLQADLDEAKKLATTRDQANRREVDARLREQKRNSDRCRAQQAGTSKAVQDDC
jgi:hypothetical protein